MINRYQYEPITKIWSDENKYQTWADVEVAVVEAWNKLKVIPTKDLKRIQSKLKVNLKRMQKLEAETKHDVVAFTRMLSESLGDEKRWIHLGITSTDIVDTAQNILIKQSSEVFLELLNELKKVLLSLATEHKKTYIMGRSHGIQGEPTSLGLKFLLWLEEVKRQEIRLKAAFNDVCVTKISGSMGNYANLEIEVENYVATKVSMKADTLSTQVSQRDRHASMFLAFANFGSTMEKIATEIRLYQQTEIGELMEGFSENQKGSSSMPHKKNPISSENITGLARLIRSYAIPSLENNVLWHERDISHSSNERIMLPDVFNLVCYITNRMNDVLKNLYVNQAQMLKNIENANEVYYSQPLLTYILINKNFSREDVYDFIQKATLKALQENRNFKNVLIEDGIDQFISVKELDSIFKLDTFLKNIDKIYKKVK